MIELDLEYQNKYILACSYGPDSMSLFSLLLQNHYEFVVCFVNYHLRKESDEEEQGLINFAKLHNVTLFIKEAFYSKAIDKNMEAWARKIRYDFFKEISKKTNIENILIAHNEDDNLETYYIQKKRNNLVTHYGLSSYYSLNNINYIRPLLKYSKKELQDYCVSNNVPFAIDLSNFDNKYLRNNLRNNLVLKMDKKTRFEEIERINNENLNLEIKRLSFKKYLVNPYLNFDDCLNLSIENFHFLLICFINSHNFYYPISFNEARDIYEKMQMNKNFKITKEQFSLFFSYRLIYILDNEVKPYKFVLKENEKCSMFSINKNNKNFELLKNAFPITIKPINPDETYTYGNVTKKVNRCFVDWKLPSIYRGFWPGIYGKDKNLLYVPHYKKNYIEDVDNSLIQFYETDLVRK